MLEEKMGEVHKSAHEPSPITAVKRVIEIIHGKVSIDMGFVPTEIRPFLSTLIKNM